MIISFDFDDTLHWTRVTRDADGNIEDVVPVGVNPDVMPLLLEALVRNDEVHVVTTRHASHWREDTLRHLRDWGVLDRLAGVHFTDGALKQDTLAALGVSVHHDDDPEELDSLPFGCRGVLASAHPSWRKPTKPIPTPRQTESSARARLGGTDDG